MSIESTSGPVSGISRLSDSVSLARDYLASHDHSGNCSDVMSSRCQSELTTKASPIEMRSVKTADIDHDVIEKKFRTDSKRRRFSSLRILLEPTGAVDSGWSWVVCAATFFINFVVLGTLASFGVLYVGLLEHYTGSNSTGSYCGSIKNESGKSAITAWIGSQASMLTFVLGPFSASLVARWGVRPVIMVGSVLFSIGAFLTAATNETWHAILTYGVILGTGGSLALTPASGILPAYFSRRTAFAACLSRSAGSVAGLCMTPVNQAVLDKFGWRAVCLLIGSYGSLMLVSAAMYRPRVQLDDNPKPTVKQIAVQACNTLKNVRYTVWLCLVAVHYFTLYLILYHLIRHAECKLGVPGSEAALLVTYISLVGAVSGIVAGYVADYVENRVFLLQIAIFVCGVTNLCFPFFKTYSELVGYSILFGAAGCFRSLVAVIPSDLVSLEEVVNAWGVFSLVVGLTTSAGGPFGGWIYDTTGSYNTAFCISGGLSVASSFLMFSDIYFKRNQKMNKKTADTTEPVKENVVATYETSV